MNSFTIKGVNTRFSTSHQFTSTPVLFKRLQSFFLSPGYDVIAMDHLHPLGACSLTFCANIKHILVETLTTGPLIVRDAPSGCNQHALLQPFALYFFPQTNVFSQIYLSPLSRAKNEFHSTRSTQPHQQACKSALKGKTGAIVSLSLHFSHKAMRFISEF